MSKSAGSAYGLGPGSMLRRIEGIAWRTIEGEAVLVNVRSDEVMHLNTSASFLWSNLDGVLSLEDIARSMTEEYEVTLEEALADAVVFAGMLVEKGVAEIAGLE